jgi:4-hydroxy-3-methylbut-2-enyl diphosphate reductase
MWSRPLERKGAIFVNEVDEVPEGAPHRTLRARRSPAVAAAAERKLEAIDATRPLVTKVHREVPPRRRLPDPADRAMPANEEVEGTMGHAPERTTS